ncbi:PEP/pyruvate-binding domain-containing protein [Crossiella cryophila]|uniref:Pyruvate phosphate dikinase AMP/ATP-binding domain-containing protein n=1 Tax=Crossiella cryophila TaxID=43355 RepID=A0A7W7FY23_9PSEU|nr:PEP/pyruvate-binding domain-containing protein [Crossiella cryophila]MBB4681635.1 hypothetical protein [Crossiella cryophila]
MPAAPTETDLVHAIIGEKLSLAAFDQLSGMLAGQPFVKLVVDREQGVIHFINNAHREFHVQYVGLDILGMDFDELAANVNSFNDSVYHDPDRRFYLGILALHKRTAHEGGAERRFISLETVEVDTMSADMIRFFYGFVREWVDPSVPLVFKPATHLQERFLDSIPPAELPRVTAHELFASTRFVPLNPGTATGRLRAFATDKDYAAAANTLEWFDIIVMDRVPDDIPRLAGIINAQHTTPLSHTNVLASGWKIPNAIQLGVLETIAEGKLDGQWVEYRVESGGTEISLTPAEAPADLVAPPAWRAQQITLEEPETERTPILDMHKLRASDRHRYGTKAANLGELRHVLDHGSDRLLGFYQVPRPPRPNLLSYLARNLDVPENDELAGAAWQFLRDNVRIPRGIAIPFAVQQRFLQSSPRIQQTIGKLKMALELDVPEAEPLSLALQKLIRTARMPEDIRQEIDSAIVEQLGGVRTFVVRSSSNAEDLDGFSAAGIYESVNHVSTAEAIFDSIKLVWASLVSPRSVRLRQQAGISLDDCYMGVIVQEQVDAPVGGVLVTTNPMARNDFRNVYVNVSPEVTDVVSGTVMPMQYLYSTVEGGGRTLSLGDAKEDLSAGIQAMLQKLALAGRLLQSHFSPDYTFAAPVDIEWVTSAERVHILQLRPYSV